MNIVYVAGGLNTRFEDLSIFPKILLPIEGNTSILEHNYKIFDRHDQYLIINAQYYDMVNQFVHMNGLDNLNVVRCQNTNGSYNSIASVASKIPQRHAYIIWSDLIFDRDFINEMPDDVNVIFTKAGGFRYYADNEKVVQQENGNVPGVYFLNYVPSLVMHEQLDLIERITHHKYIVQELNANILELRDKQTYLEYLNSQPQRRQNPRHFNSLEINNDIVIKQATKGSYIHLIEREAAWYNKVKGFGIAPKLIQAHRNDYFNINKLEIEYLDGYVTLHQLWNNYKDDPSFQNAILMRIEDHIGQMNTIDKIHIKAEKMVTDFTHEFYQKVLERVHSVRHMIFDYDANYLSQILSIALVKIIAHQMNYVDEHGNATYRIIHGDLNGSNILIHPETFDVKFIDPRGYFGSSMTYGPRIYDYAKLNYFLHGYDDFNLGNYIYTENNFKKPPIYRFDYFTSNIINIMTAIIYISLTSYICDNVMKVNIAYEHGIKLLLDALDKEK